MPDRISKNLTKSSWPLCRFPYNGFYFFNRLGNILDGMCIGRRCPEFGRLPVNRSCTVEIGIKTRLS